MNESLNLPANKTDKNFHIFYYGLSDIGLVRSENQDSFGKFPEDNLDIYSDKGQLFIVADGVGGHIGGKEASQSAVKVISEVYFSSFSDAASLKRAIEEANYRIYNNENSSENTRMATTCCALVIKDDKAFIAHVGDSRVYKIEKSKIEQLTEDHTKVNEMIKVGLLSEEAAKNHPAKSVLARALGVEEKVKVDISDYISLADNQYFVLCTDGLSNVSSEEILSITKNNSPENSCKKLIAIAKERGGKDNVTVQVVKISQVKSSINSEYSSEIEDKSKNKVLKKKFLIVIILILTIIFIGFQFRNLFPFLATDNLTAQDNIKEEKKEIIVDGINNADKMLNEADNFYKNGEIEKAYLLYKNILVNEPMHLKALQGINNIADFYFKKAEEFRKGKNFKKALTFYLKAEELQPENEKIKAMIVSSKQHLK